MPLEDYLPSIDDRRYDDIVNEIRTRIARYTPEWKPVWTDVNDSDPGITMVQVFAWLSEMLIYRMGKVPDLNYIKFLQLLGIELSPAESARAEITFPVLPSYSQSSLIIPMRSQVSAESSEDQSLIVFETERSLVALRAAMDGVQVFDGYAYTDVSLENEEATQGFQPFGPLAKTDSALLLGFDDSDPLPQVELALFVLVAEQGSASKAYDCGLPDSAVYSSAELVWEYWSGSDWRALSLLKDETRAFTQTGFVYVKLPLKGSIAKTTMGQVTGNHYWIRVRVKRSAYEKAPKLLAIRTNTIYAVQAETVKDEVLGGSNGRPNQVFGLANTPVLAGTLMLEVDEGDGFQTWTEVGDFFGSGADDRHYVLNRTTGEIRFGDGTHGRIPVGNVQNPAANIVAREYRFGGSKKGNVAVNSLTTPLTSVAGMDENGITNLRAAYGGRDEETLDEAKLRAPESLKNKCRAVTEEDFQQLAMEAANIKRARALPLYHPDFPDVKVPGVVTVIVVPDNDEPNPIPSEGTLRTVCAYLNQRRLLTTELYVIKPTYLQVVITANVIAQNNADLGEVKQAIDSRLLEYFHPLKGGETGQGWPFGGDIYFSLVYRRVLEVAGVSRIESIVIAVDGKEALECTDVTVPDGALVYSTEHDIQVNYSLE